MMAMAWLQSRVAEALGWALVHSLWQVMVVAALVGLALAALRRKDATVRYVVGSVGLGCMLMMPVGTFFYVWSPGAAEAAVVMAQPGPAHEARDEERPVFVGGTPAWLRGTVVPAAAPTPTMLARVTAGIRKVLPQAVMVYLAGAMLLTARLLAGYVRLYVLARRARPLGGGVEMALEEMRRRLGIGRAVRLLESALVEVPTLMGALRPVILLPASALTGLSTEQLAVLIAHELAHVRRHDYVANVVQSVVETLLFYHPAAWWLSARIRQERENCCDDVVVRLTGNTLGYAGALAAMEGMRAGPARVPAGLVMGARTGALLPRIRRLLGAPAERRGGGRAMGVTSGLVMVAALGAAVYVLGFGRTEAAAPVAQKSAPATAEAVPAGSRTASLVPSSGVNARASAALEKELAVISAEKQDLEKVLDFLRDNAEVNLFVNWKELEAAGVHRNSPVTINLHDVTFRKALATVLAEVSEGNAKVGYTIDDGIVTISTKDDLSSQKYQLVQVYDIRDLLVIINSPPAPSLNPEQAGWANRRVPEQIDPKTAREMVLTNIMESIRSTVAPDTWRDNGGTIGSIRELNGQLIVNQTADNQKAIRVLLQQLREPRGIQVAVEAKLLLVDETTMKAMDFPVPEVQMIPTSQAPGSLAPMQAPATSATYRMIGEKELMALMKKAESSANTSTLAAPRLTLFNGQSGFIAQTNHENYVATCKVRKDETGKEAPDQEVKTLESGLVFSMEATVSADRKNVVMQLHPSMRRLLNMEKFHAPNMPPGEEFFIQVPTWRAAEMSTTVSVPDGQYLVMTGLKFVGDFPVARDGEKKAEDRKDLPERLLVIIVHPNVIVHKEIESDLMK